MSGFWIAGIIVNVTLTALAIYWVIRNMKPRAGKRGSKSKPLDPGNE